MSNRRQQRENEEYLVTSEARALRFIMKYPDYRHEFRPSMFIHDTARQLYESISEVIDSGGSVDPSSVSAVANQKNDKLTLKVVKGLLFDPSQEEDLVEGDKKLLLEQLEHAEVRNRVVKKLQETTNFAQEPNVPNEEYFGKISQLITEAQSEAMSRGGSPLITLNQSYDKYYQELEDRESGAIAYSGDILLDKALTRKTAGGQMILLAGATGSGKSLYMLNLLNGFINLDIPAIYVTLEMDLMSTMDRLAALRLGVPIDEWYNPDNITNLKKKIAKEKTTIENSRVEIIEDPSLSIADLSAITAEYRSKHNIDPNERVIVMPDLITQIKDFSTGNRGYSMANNYEMAVNAMNVYVKLQNVCLIGSAQFNRNADTVDIQGPEDIRKTRPTLNDIKNSAALGERSRVVLSAWRPKYYMERYLPDMEETHTAEDLMYIQVLKQSQGAVGKQLVYAFEGAVAKIIPTTDSSLDDDDMISPDDENLLNQVHF